MKHLEIDVYEPGDMLATMSKDGKVAVFTISPSGELVSSDNRLFNTDLTYEDPIEALDLTVRTYNVLKRERVNTIGEVAALYDEKGVAGFDAMRNMGEKGRNEIVGHIMRLRGEES